MVPKRELAMREEVDVRTGCYLKNLVKILMNLAPPPVLPMCQILGTRECVFTSVTFQVW